MRTAMRQSRKPPVKEISLHMSAAAYIRRAWPEHLPWWHTPNGEKRDARTAGKLKGMGVLAGVPDFSFVMPNGQAAFIELKNADEGLSDSQIEFRDRVLAARCGYAVCRTMEQVEDTLTRWLAAYGLEPRARLMRRAA